MNRITSNRMTNIWNNWKLKYYIQFPCLSIFLSAPISLSLSLPHSHSLSLRYQRSHSFSLFISPYHTLSLSQPPTLSLFFSVSICLSLSHTQPPHSLPLSLSLCDDYLFISLTHSVNQTPTLSRAHSAPPHFPLSLCGYLLISLPHSSTHTLSLFLCCYLFNALSHQYN